MAYHKPSNIEMPRRLLRCLRGLDWLNDEVINFYMGMLQVQHFSGTALLHLLLCSSLSGCVKQYLSSFSELSVSLKVFSPPCLMSACLYLCKAACCASKSLPVQLVSGQK